MKIRILTYNIHKGFNTLNTQFMLRHLKSAIHELDCDLVFLQEVVGKNDKLQRKISDWPLQSQFEFLADTVWNHYSYGKNAVFSYRNHGNAILSKFPIEKWENIDISNHKLERRGLLHCEIRIPELNKKMHLFNVHLDLTDWGRKKQFTRIAHRAVNHTSSDEPLIIAGDFNDWRNSLTKKFTTNLGLKEAHTVLSGHPAKTFPVFLPFLSLDRIFYRHINPLKCQTLDHQPWSKISDHLPIFAEFEIE